MPRKQRTILGAAIVFAIMLGALPAASAMHIMEGYLPLGIAFSGARSACRFSWQAYWPLKSHSGEQKSAAHTRHGRRLRVRALRTQDPFGYRQQLAPHWHRPGRDTLWAKHNERSGHHRAAVPGDTLAHGGLTTLGANTFSMAIAGPFVSYGVYKLSLKLKLGKNRRISRRRAWRPFHLLRNQFPARACA